MDERLAAELAAMATEDLRVKATDDRVFARRVSMRERMDLTRVGVAHTDRLRDVVADVGWPGRALVGDEGAEHAWLLAQHADRQLDSQRLFLAALRRAVEAGDAPAWHLAYLTDRVAMNEGRPQCYGTQVAEMARGEAVSWPIENPGGVDERRATMGLSPLSEHLAQWRGMT